MNWPATGEELKAAGYKALGSEKCASCEAPITWAQNPAGGTIALELVPDDDPEVRRFRSHFGSCFAKVTERRKGAGSDVTLPVHKEG